MNSPNFLIRDTHSEYFKNAGVWMCLKENGVSALDIEDPVALQRAFGINAQLSFVYYKIILDRWSQLNLE